MGSVWVLSGAERGLVSKLFGREGSKVRIRGQWAGLVNQVEPALFYGPSLYYISRMLCCFFFYKWKTETSPSKKDCELLHCDTRFVMIRRLEPKPQYRRGVPAEWKFYSGCSVKPCRAWGKRETQSDLHVVKSSWLLRRTAGNTARGLNRRPLQRAGEPWWPDWWRKETDEVHFGGSRFLAGCRRR